MEILMLFFVLFGVGALLGLAYVGLKAIMMAAKGLRVAGRDLARVNRESWQRAKAEHEAAQAAKAARLRERP